MEAEVSQIFDVVCSLTKVPTKINKLNQGWGQSINLLEKDFLLLPITKIEYNLSTAICA